ncbi:MAG: hypothetical protein HY815_27675 [Candidatus Riflebacteria bacterium]|nr:hypothetical protein [Candidatus Riflebacteria bacterium]
MSRKGRGSRTFAVALALACLLVPAGAVCAQTPADEWGRDDIDPYSGLPRTGTTATGPADASTTSPQYGAGGVAGFTQNGQVRQENMPWSGVWWPRKPCELAFMGFSQGLSPLEKYDSLVYSNWGRNPGAAAWEADPQNKHNDAPQQGVDWAGHCNGLAAAAILEPEPKASIRVPVGQYAAFLKLNIAHPSYARSGLWRDGQDDYRYYRASGQSIELTVADQKGWLCEMYMDVNCQQFENRDLLGRRYNSPDPNLQDPSYRDIYPHYFHYLLQAFLKNRQQAFVCEVDPGFPVNNHPLFKYDSTSVYYPNQGKYAVTTTVYFTDYGRGYNDVGTNVTRQTYTYDLFLDQQGRIQWGEWTGSSQYNHPDFIWIPTQLARSGNGYANTALDPRFAQYLMGRNGGRQQ